MRIKTAELKGAALDWCVAQIEGIQLTQARLSFIMERYGAIQRQIGGVYNPSNNWELGGRIIEENKIISDFDRNKSAIEPWQCSLSINRYNLFYGSTMLIAAMRCYVDSKLGDVVDLPDELLI